MTPPKTMIAQSTLHASAREKLRASGRSLPGRPGVYIMLDAQGDVIYVGKGVNLRRRVSSYTTNTAMSDRKIEKLVSQFDSLAHIETQSEIEALLTESRLIKAHMPIFNRLLTEPESCCFFKIDRDDRFPRIQLVPEHHEDGSLYIGPVWRSAAARYAADAVADLFNLRHCSGTLPRSGRPGCIYYEFHKCCGPCEGEVSAEEYAERIEEAVRALAEPDEAIRQLTEKRDGCIEALRFERAGKIHERIRALEYVSSSCTDTVMAAGNLAAVVPSYLPGRPAVLLFSHSRLVWKTLAGPRSYPGRKLIAKHLARLESRTDDLLPGKPSRDDFLILQSYMRRKCLTEMLLPISSETSTSDSTESLLRVIEASRVS